MNMCCEYADAQIPIKRKGQHALLFLMFHCTRRLGHDGLHRHGKCEWDGRENTCNVMSDYVREG